jgi:F-type H+-transporting ATPase subunit a
MDFKAILKSRRGRVVLLLVVLGVAGLCAAGVILQKDDLPVISLAAEKIPLPFLEPVVGPDAPLSFLGPFFLVSEGDPTPGIYNTLTATWLTMSVLILIGWGYRRAMRSEGPPSRFQVAVEAVGEVLVGFISDVGGEHARLFFPLVATFFLFIAISNWFGILPGFGSIGVYVEHHHEEPAVEEMHGEEIHTEEETHAEGEEGHGEELVLVPFFRSANAHLSTTLALAIVSVVAAQYYGLKVQGTPYLQKYFNFQATSPKPETPREGMQGTIDKFSRGVEVVVNGIVGLLELILESLKVLPFAFRLFGNIFAGEVLLFVVSFLFAFVFPVIFLGLEVFVGLIQALIFSMLTLVFFTVATTGHHGGESH